MFNPADWIGYPRTTKVWGYEIQLINCPLYCAKILVVTPGYTCSLHRHAIKTETFFVLEGRLGVQVGYTNEHEVKTVGDCIHLPPGTFHRFWCANNNHAVFLEVSTTHDDSDVERLEESRYIGPASE